MPIPEDSGIVPKAPQSGRTNVDAATFDGLEMRALIELLNKRDNYLTNRITQLQNVLETVKSTGGTAANRLDTLPNNYLATSTRDRAEAIQDYKDLIANGDADP
jgi:hypothetical protein